MTGNTTTVEVKSGIEYNVPFEVTQTQYNILMNHFAGVVAGREEEGKYYIKVWYEKYIPVITNF